MNSSLIIVLIGIGALLIVMGACLRNSKTRKKDTNKGKITSSADLKEKILDSQWVNDFGSRFGSNKELNKLFNKSKNPWHLTPALYNTIRYGGLIVSIVCAIIFYFFFGLVAVLIFGIIGFSCYYFPKHEYEKAARERERQWNQLYQFMWVIKHNANFYDPKKVWFETANYIKTHTSGNLPELEQGFNDFASHWNGEYMDEYITKNYGEFAIPKELFNIMIVSHQTGEYPKNELDSLREIIINRMDYEVSQTLSTVGSKATMVSAPFLMGSLFVAEIFPVVLMIFSAFS